MKAKNKKEFDAVEFMRQTRDKISREIADLNFEQIKEYLAKKREKTRIIPSR
jgi:hypothetical protein